MWGESLDAVHELPRNFLVAEAKWLLQLQQMTSLALYTSCAERYFETPLLSPARDVGDLLRQSELPAERLDLGALRGIQKPAAQQSSERDQPGRIVLRP